MMTWIEIALTLLFFLFLGTVALALYYFGLLEEINVKVGPSPVSFTGQTVAYKLARGPYNKSGHLFTQLTCDLVDLEPDPSTASDLVTMGFYYDDVEMMTDESKLRYAIGVILPSDDEARRNALKTGLESRGYSFTVLPKIDHVVYTCFPFKSTISILIAVRRVYPVIRAFIAQHNLCAHPALEIYDKEYIHFILPLSKQDSFYLFDSDDEEEEVEDEEESEITDSETTGRASNSEAEHEEDGFADRPRKRSSTKLLEGEDDDDVRERTPISGRSPSKTATSTGSTNNSPTKNKPSISRTSTSSFEEIATEPS